MSTISSMTSRSATVICVENLHFDYPDADIILRSRDSHEFHVLKVYILHSSPILGEEVLISPNTLPSPSVILAESEVDGPTSADTLQTVELPIDGAILFSLLSYIFPVTPILPSTPEEIMELLSVAQMYKMDIVLTHIRSHIAEQNPSFIRKETAYIVYSLAQKYGLRTEALQAARCTLSLFTFTIWELLSEGKLAIMPGAALHELWKYHQNVRSNLASDLKKFRTSQGYLKLGDSNCISLTDSGIPRWLDAYISTLGSTQAPVSLDFIAFYMKLTEHIQCKNPETDDKCSSCTNIPSDKIHAFWDTLTAAVDNSIPKVRAQFTDVADRVHNLYRPNQILRSSLWEREQRLLVKTAHPATRRPTLRRSTQTCLMWISSSSRPIPVISVSTNQCLSRHRRFSATRSLSHNPHAENSLTVFTWFTCTRMRTY